MSASSYVVGAVLAAAVGGVALGAATYERHMADVRQHLATHRYVEAAGALDAAARYASSARWVPWLAERASRDIRTRDAMLRYWRGDYEGVLRARAAAVAEGDVDNVELQLVAANAGYRAARDRMTNRAAAVQALDEVMSGYLDVLRQRTWMEDAAHNYELVARLRDDIARGRRRPETPDSTSDALGQTGAPAVQDTRQPFEIYIPLENEERQDGEAGKAAPRQRRG